MRRCHQRILWGSDLKYAFDHLKEYDDPAFREAQVREFFEAGLDGRGRNKETLWCTLYLCNEEMHSLYSREYKSRYRDMSKANDRWLHDFMVEEDMKANEKILATHKQGWDGMSASERAQKICWGGRPSRYLFAAASTTAVASVFFFFRYGSSV